MGIRDGDTFNAATWNFQPVSVHSVALSWATADLCIRFMIMANKLGFCQTY